MIGVFIDPGKNGCGYSVFEGRELLHAGYTGGYGGQVHPMMEPAGALERELEELANVFGERRFADIVVIEVPQVYDTAKQRGDQRDLIDLAVVVGSLLHMAATYARGGLLVRPSEYKGQVPKDICEKRTRAALSTDELSRVELPKAGSLHHNVWDAIQLGLWRVRP